MMIHRTRIFWYLIMLIANAESAPSLTYNRFHASYSVLQEILTLASWSEEEAQEIVYGNRLDTILKPYGNQLFLDEFWLYGGCLRFQDVKRIWKRLIASKQYFFDDTYLQAEETERLAYYNQKPPEQLVKMAYHDAIDMLQTVIDKQQDLYLLLDW